MSVKYDVNRDYLKHPLGINYTIFDPYVAKFGDVKWSLKVLARNGNKPASYDVLQKIFDEIKPGNRSRFGMIVRNANERIRSYRRKKEGEMNGGKLPPKREFGLSQEKCGCQTPNFHLLCTKLKKETEECTRRNVLTYVDNEFFELFNNSGVDQFPPGISEDIRRNKPNKSTSLKKKRIQSKGDSSSSESESESESNPSSSHPSSHRHVYANKRRKASPKIDDFSKDMMSPPEESPPRRNRIPSIDIPIPPLQSKADDAEIETFDAISSPSQWDEFDLLEPDDDGCTDDEQDGQNEQDGQDGLDGQNGPGEHFEEHVMNDVGDINREHTVDGTSATDEISVIQNESAGMSLQGELTPYFGEIRQQDFDIFNIFSDLENCTESYPELINNEFSQTSLGIPEEEEQQIQQHQQSQQHFQESIQQHIQQQHIQQPQSAPQYSQQPPPPSHLMSTIPQMQQHLQQQQMQQHLQQPFTNPQSQCTGLELLNMIQGDCTSAELCTGSQFERANHLFSDLPVLPRIPFYLPTPFESYNVHEQMNNINNRPAHSLNPYHLSNDYSGYSNNMYADNNDVFNERLASIELLRRLRASQDNTLNIVPPGHHSRNYNVHNTNNTNNSPTGNNRAFMNHTNSQYDHLLNDDFNHFNAFGSM